MNDRPQRKPEVPLINPAATAGRELAENFRLIYAGALADHRSIEAGGGIYAVRAVAPLEVTDDGVGLNWQDPRVYQVMGDLLLNLPESGKVKVDDGDVPDFLENQLVDYTGPTDQWIGVDIVKPAPHEPLQARIAKAALPPPPGGGNGGGEGSLELFIRYKGTDTISQTLSDDDWRPRLLRVWARSADTLDHLLGISNPISGLAAWLWPLRHSFATVTPIVSLPYDTGIQSTNNNIAISFRVWADELDGGRLKLVIQHPSPVVYFGTWDGGVEYSSTDVVTDGGSYYQSKFNGNQNHPTADLDWWDPYAMLEGWFHCRLDIMGTVPTTGAVSKGNASE
jgi:hypothetical protein